MNKWRDVTFYNDEPIALKIVVGNGLKVIKLMLNYHINLINYQNNLIKFFKIRQKPKTDEKLEMEVLENLR